jgi:hypothetical protein
LPPPGYSTTAPDLGYNTPPAYFYETQSVPACPGQAAPASPAWINVDETTQIGLDQMFAGGPAIQDSANTAPQLIRFAAKANHVEYGYVAQNQYFLPDKLKLPAMNNQNAYNYTKNMPPVAPTPPFISFMQGTIEIKSAWRPLNANDNPMRFHVQTVRFYEEKGPKNAPCYFEQNWGLIALHIIQKTPSAAAFIYATFEQADNIRQPNATPVEDPDGNVIQPITPPVAPTTPALAYEDSTAPKVTVTPEGASFCTPQNNLYFKDNPNFAGLTGGGAICINQRYGPIPSDVIAVNLAAHVAITSYDTANGIGNSPWLYYKLVSVQATPFDVSTILPTDPIHGPAAFFQANIVVETDYTLQRFQGNFADSLAPTALGTRRLMSSYRQQIRRPVSSESIWVAVWAAMAAARKSPAAPILASSWRRCRVATGRDPPPRPTRCPRSPMPQCPKDIWICSGAKTGDISMALTQPC